MRPLLPGPIFEAFGTDADGRPTRDRTIAPCGCWEGWVYRDAPIGRDAAGHFVMGKDWDWRQGGCETHSGVLAVASLRLAERLNGAASLPEHARNFLNKHSERILTEAREIDAALIQIGYGGNTIARSFGEALSSARRMPLTPKPHELPAHTDEPTDT